MTFSIRELLLLTVIVAFFVSWSKDRLRFAAELEQLRTKQSDVDSAIPRKVMVNYQHAMEIDDEIFGLPASSAPVPNPPKDHKD